MVAQGDRIDRIRLHPVARDAAVPGARAEERVAFYQTVVISAVANWINKLALNELAEKSRCKLRPVPNDDDPDAA